MEQRQLETFYTSATTKDEWLISRFGRLTSNILLTQWRRDTVGRNTYLDTMLMNRNGSPLGN